MPLDDTIGKLVRRHGVYLISQHGRVIYVGHAQGAETFLTRLRKHRLKLTGSDGGSGIHHPLRWRLFAQQRYAGGAMRPEDDTLADLAFSLFVVGEPTPCGVREVEGGVYAGCLAWEPPLLNDPRRIRSGVAPIAVSPPPG